MLWGWYWWCHGGDGDGVGEGGIEKQNRNEVWAMKIHRSKE